MGGGNLAVIYYFFFFFVRSTTLSVLKALCMLLPCVFSVLEGLVWGLFVDVRYFFLVEMFWLFPTLSLFISLFLTLVVWYQPPS